MVDPFGQSIEGVCQFVREIRRAEVDRNDPFTGGQSVHGLMQTKQRSGKAIDQSEHAPDRSGIMASAATIIGQNSRHTSSAWL